MGRMAAFLTDLLEQAGGQYRGPRGAALIQRVRSEEANLDVALAWLLNADDVDSFVRLVVACCPYWRAADRHAADPWLTHALTTGRLSAHQRAVVLRASASMQFDALDLPGAYPKFLESARLFEDVGDQSGLADALVGQGNIELAMGLTESAKSTLTRALDVAETSGDELSRLGALGNLSLLAIIEGDLERSLELSHQIERDATRLGDLTSVGMSAGNISSILLALAQPQEAVAAARRSAAAFRKVANRSDLAWALGNLAQALLRAGATTSEVLEPLRETMRLAEETGSRWSYLALLAVLAEFRLHVADPEGATRCLAALERLRSSQRYEFSPHEQRDIEGLGRRARRDLGTDGYDKAWHEGSSADEIELLKRYLGIGGDGWAPEERA